MLSFTPQSVGDLSHILAGLFSFTINGASIPALDPIHAERVYDEIVDQIYTIPQQSLHCKNTFEGLERYGEYVFTYKRNRTNWYAFYDKNGDDFVVNRITNNWNVLLPRL